MKILLFIYILSKLNIEKKIFKHISDIEIEFLQTNKQSPPPPLLLHT
jgi:hypothetical protein